MSDTVDEKLDSIRDRLLGVATAENERKAARIVELEAEAKTLRDRLVDAYKSIAACPYRKDEETYRGFVLVTLEKALAVRDNPDPVEAQVDGVMRLLGRLDEIAEPSRFAGVCDHVYPSAWWGINPPPCMRCGR
jgi:hypothetical protein